MSADGYDYVRDYYGVKVELGQRVTVDGRPGVIRTPHPPSGDQYLWVRFDDDTRVLPCHPTWRVLDELTGRRLVDGEKVG